MNLKEYLKSEMWYPHYKGLSSQEVEVSEVLNASLEKISSTENLELLVKILNDIVERNPSSKKNCETCKNLEGVCDLHRDPETPEARAERRQSFISYALSKGEGIMDEDELIKEAGEKFDAENPL